MLLVSEVKGALDGAEPRDTGLSAGLRAELGKDSQATHSNSAARLGIQGFRWE